MTKKGRKKKGKQGIWKWLKNRLFKGISEGIEDIIKKFAISAIGALFVAISTFVITNKSDLFANVFHEFKNENLQEIINQSVSGSVIDISDRTFNENTITIDKNLTIRGDDDSYIVGDEDSTILIIKNNAEVSIENVNFTFGEIGIQAEEGVSIVVKSCAFSENEISIEAKNASSVYIENSFFEKSSDAAIHVAGIASGQINKNTLSQNRIGIVAENSTMNISENMIKNSTDNAIYLFDDSSEIYKNVINRVFYGTGINFRKGIHKTKVNENVFASMKIGLYSISDAEIRDVSAKKNTFVKISENEILLTSSNPENFSGNQKDDFWNELDAKGIGCDKEICI